MGKMILKGKIKKVISDKNGYFICHFIPNKDIEKGLPEGALNNVKTYGIIKGYGQDFHNDLELELKGQFEVNKFMPNNDFAIKYTPKLVFNFSSYEVIGEINEDIILKDFFIKNVPFVGEKTADILFKEYNGDTLLEILKEEEYSSVEKLKKIKGLGKKKATGIYEGWCKLADRREVLIELFKYELTLSQSNKIYDFFGKDILKKIKTNPFIITEAKGIGLSVAEKLANNMGIKKNSPDRYIAITNHFIKEISKTDTLVAKDNIIEHIRNYMLNEKKEESNNLFEYNIEEIVTIGIEGNIKKGFIKKINENIYILSSFEKIEKYLYKRITEKKDKENTVPFDVKSIEGIDFLTNEQLQAVEKSLLKKLSILVGPAGSGKTTTSQFIVKGIQKMGKSLVIIAPTNKAVARIKEVNGENVDCLTIHKLLGLKPGSSDTNYNQDNPLPYDYVLVDETSMTGIYNMYLLLKAIKEDTSIVFLGDNNQLPSIEAGSFYNDIVESSFLQNNLSRLTVVKRVSNGDDRGIGEIIPGVNNIIANSQKILKGEKLISTNSNSFIKTYERITDNEKEEIYGYIKSIYKKLEQNGIDYNKDFQILIPTYRGDLGINAINELVSSITNPNPMIQINSLKVKVNDKIFYDDKHQEYGLVKGDTGYVTKINTDEKRIYCYFYTLKKEVSFSFLETGPLKLGYCLSIHKSQGSEYPYTFLILTSQAYTMLSRNLLYTGYTRGKKKVYLFSDSNALRMALKNKESAKNTYLFNLLEGIEDKDIELIKNRNIDSITNEEKIFIRNKLNEKKNEENKLVKVIHENKKYLGFSYLYGKKELIKELGIYEKIILNNDKIYKDIEEKGGVFLKLVKEDSEISKAAFTKKMNNNNLFIVGIKNNDIIFF